MVSFWSFWDVACDAVKLKGCGIHQKHAGLVEFESQNLSRYFFWQESLLFCEPKQQQQSLVWRSPIFSHFSETLDGTALIRAFGQQHIFISENMSKVNKNMRAYYSNFSSNRWLAIRLESFGALITFCAGTLAVLGRHSISAGVAGLSISYALSITQALNWVVRMAADRETSIVSVERVREYLRLQLEPAHHCETCQSKARAQGGCSFGK